LQICGVKFIDLAFRLGVVFAIFGFIWGILNMLLTLLRGGRTKTVFEEYLLKSVQYFFLVNVTFLFCVQKEDSSILMPNELILAGLILILYFTGKLQNRQNRSAIFKMAGNPMPAISTMFNVKAEMVVITFSILFFTAFVFFPDYAQNPISTWFYDSILDIESTPIFGFIFKIIGFFVLLSILFKLLNGFSYLLSGAPLIKVNRQFQSRNKNDDNKFDDFEEID
jgi:hypothetical protein